ncbi:MAG: primase [Thermomicrobiales bacterium]|nr:primase [Thermomicrobiales bacterium]
MIGSGPRCGESDPPAVGRAAALWGCALGPDDDDLAGAIPEGKRLLCPFHEDGRPSAKVLPGSGRFWCFVCGFAEDRRGVAMRLLFPETHQLQRGADVQAALDWLDRQGAAPDRTHLRLKAPDPIDPDVYRAMTAFCRLANSLLATDVAALAELIRTRGLKNPVALGFGVGHWRLLGPLEHELAAVVPDWEGRREGLLQKAGVLNSKGVYGLANRFVLPEWRTLTGTSPLGRAGTRTVVFYQARSRDEDPKIKYLSPEVTKQFWGLESLSRDTGLVFIGEGTFDVAPLVEAGESALAVLGLHLGPLGEQLDGLAATIGDRLAVICFDNDQPKKDETVGVGYAQALALHAKLTGIGVRTAIVAPPHPHKDLGDWLAHVPAPRGAAELKLTL